MKVAFIIFNKMTSLDFIGIYDPVTRLKSMGFISDLSWQICAFTDTVTDDRGLKFTPDSVTEDLAAYDLLIVPGGYGTGELVNDNGFIDWLKTAAPIPLKVSVCTGSLLFGQAGFLNNRTATTHPIAMEELKRYCNAVDRRVVDEGDVITARGVTSAIDLGLYLINKMAGPKVKAKIAAQMDYPYNYQDKEQ